MIGRLQKVIVLSTAVLSIVASLAMVVMPANVRIVMLVLATVADIKAGQYFLVPNGEPTSLGTSASTIIVGSDGVDFAM
jgi:hypothetical protein